MLESLYLDDPRRGIGDARHQSVTDLPRFGSFGQFFIDILSLEKEADGPLFLQTVGKLQQLRQGRQGPRGNDIGRRNHRLLNSNGLDVGRHPHHPGGLAHESGLSDV